MINLKIKNFMPFADAEFTFPTGVTLVQGDNTVGKSALTAAIQLLLFGQSKLYKNESDVYELSRWIHNGADGYEVSGDFGGWSCRESRNGAGKRSEVGIVGKPFSYRATGSSSDKLSEQRRELLEYLGLQDLSPKRLVEIFFRSICITPESPSLVDLRQTERIEFLLKLFNIAELKDMLGKVKLFETGWKSDLLKLQATKPTNLKLENESALEAEIARLRAMLAGIGTPDTLDAKKFQLNAKKTELDYLVKSSPIRVTELKNRLAELAEFKDVDLKISAEKLQKSPNVAGLQKSLQALCTEKTQLSDEYKKSVEPKYLQLTTLGAQITNRSDDVQVVHSLKDLAANEIRQAEQILQNLAAAQKAAVCCPWCSNQLYILHNKPKKYDEIVVAQEKLRAQVNLEQANLAYDQALTNLIYLELKNRIDTLEVNFITQCEALEKEIGQKEAELETARSLEPEWKKLQGKSSYDQASVELTKIESELSSKVAVLESQIAQLTKEIEETEAHALDFSELADLESRLTISRYNRSLLNAYEAKRSELEQLETDLAHCKMLQSKVGIPGLIKLELSKRCQTLADEINEVFLKVGGKSPIRFTVEVDDSGNPKNLEIEQYLSKWTPALGDFSFSEKMLFRIASVLGARKINPPFIDLLILDDPFAGLDDTRSQLWPAGLREVLQGAGHVIIFTSDSRAREVLEPDQFYQLIREGDTTYVR